MENMTRWEIPADDTEVTLLMRTGVEVQNVSGLFNYEFAGDIANPMVEFYTSEDRHGGSSIKHRTFKAAPTSKKTSEGWEAVGTFELEGAFFKLYEKV